MFPLSLDSVIDLELWRSLLSLLGVRICVNGCFRDGVRTFQRLMLD